MSPYTFLEFWWAADAMDKENEGLKQAFGTEDFREALKARAEKRPPVFRGK